MSSESDTTTSSTYSSTKSEEDAQETEDEDWDEEEVDEELTELREVLEKSRVTVSYLEESGDSLDNEDNEMIKAKLRALREYVKDLQASYNELLQTFKLLEDAAKQKVSTMENKLAAALSCAKEFQDQCNMLESQLRDLRKSSSAKRTNPGSGINTGTSSDMRDQIETLEEDLSSVLKAITEGIESGVIKLSELQLLSQETPLPLKDVIVQTSSSSDGGVASKNGNTVLRVPGEPPPGLVSVSSRVNQSDLQQPHPLSPPTVASVLLTVATLHDQGKTAPMGVANAEISKEVYANGGGDIQPVSGMNSDNSQPVGKGHQNQVIPSQVPSQHGNSIPKIVTQPDTVLMSPTTTPNQPDTVASDSNAPSSDTVLIVDNDSHTTVHDFRTQTGVPVPDTGAQSNTVMPHADTTLLGSSTQTGVPVPDTGAQSNTGMPHADTTLLGSSTQTGVPVPDTGAQSNAVTCIPNSNTQSDAAVLDSRTQTDTSVPNANIRTDSNASQGHGIQTNSPVTAGSKHFSGAMVMSPDTCTQKSGSSAIAQPRDPLTNSGYTENAFLTGTTDDPSFQNGAGDDKKVDSTSQTTFTTPHKMDAPSPGSVSPSTNTNTLAQMPGTIHTSDEVQTNTRTPIPNGKETQSGTAPEMSPIPSHSMSTRPSHTSPPVASGHIDEKIGKPQSLFPSLENGSSVPLSNGTQIHSQPDSQSPSQAVFPFQQSHSHAPDHQNLEPDSGFFSTSNNSQCYSSQAENLNERFLPKLEAWNESSSTNASVDEFGSPEKDEIELGTNDLLSQLLEKDCRIAELETCIEDLQYQLQESLHAQESTQLSLDDAQEMLRNQKIDKVLDNEQELSNVMSKLSHYEMEKAELQQKVEKEQEKVLELEGKRDENIVEMVQLRERIAALSQLIPTTADDHTAATGKESITVGDDEGEETGDEETEQLLSRTRLALNESNLQSLREETEVLEGQREELQKQCEDVEGKVELLQSSLRAAKHEAHRLQATSARKEAELKRLAAAIHAARAKLSALHQAEPSHGIADDNIKGLEWDLTEVKKKWEELCEDLSKHEAAMASLIGRELTLQGELDHRAARVLELEALVQARDLGMGFNKKSASGLQAALGLLKTDFMSMQTEYVQANKEMEEVQQRLNSAVHSLVEQLECLKNQVTRRDERIGQLEADQSSLWSLYQNTKDKIKEEEEVKMRREQALLEISEELSLAKQRVEELEDALEQDQQLREKDLDYQKAVVMDVISQLTQVTGENNEDNDLDQVVSVEPESLQSRLAQRDLLLQTLQEQTTLLVEQHANTAQQVEDRQELVRSLESKLLTTQTLCDALEQEVADSHKKLMKVQKQLLESEKERMSLQEQLQTLQNETEDACTGLEQALNRNELLEEHSRDQLNVVQKELLAERTLSTHYKTKVNELSDAVVEKDGELAGLRSTVEGLELENVRLQADTLRHQSVIAKLKEETELKYSSDSRRELAQSLVMVDSLQSQLNDAESEKLTAETIAQERLHDVMVLQEQNQHLSSVNKQMEYKLSSLGSSNQRGYQERMDCLNEEMATVKALYEAKSVELDKLKYTYQVSQERESQIIDQLEECRRELAVCKKRADELDIRYQNSLTELSVYQTELEGVRSLQSSQKAFQGSSKEGMKELNTKVMRLEAELKSARDSLERAQMSVASAREEKRRLLHKLGALEEHHSALIRTSSQQKLDLSRSKSRFEEQRKLCLSLQSDYDSLAEQVSDWAEKNSTTTDALVQKIREQDKEISSLKAQQRQLVVDNGQLRGHLASSAQSSGDPAHQPVSKASDLPQLDYQYQQLLEKGLSSTSALDTSGYSSPAESTDDLDKSYWIRRAGELSVQLQQSSEYWSTKVREQALKIQKYESK